DGRQRRIIFHQQDICSACASQGRAAHSDRSTELTGNIYVSGGIDGDTPAFVVRRTGLTNLFGRLHSSVAAELGKKQVSVPLAGDLDGTEVSCGPEYACHIDIVC